MGIQFLFVVLFALNMLSIWLTVILKRCGWYRLPGSFIFAYLPLLPVYFDQPRFQLDFLWWKIAGVFALIVGIALVVWAKRFIGKAITNLAEVPEKLVVTGPYQYVRHPVYLGFVFIYVGWWWVWAAVYTFYFGMIILALVWIEAYLEEKFILEKEFGDQYREYRHYAGMFWIK